MGLRIGDLSVPVVTKDIGHTNVEQGRHDTGVDGASVFFVKHGSFCMAIHV